jgi:hypothetical protein
MSKDKPEQPRQWHPLFAQVLRPLVEEHYDVETNFPVGDAPREADIVLLRRKKRRPPFRGLWRHLTEWNVFEFKGRTVSARVRDLDLLVELGLGIDRRLNEERGRTGRPFLPSSETSFWYVANELGRRFLRDAEAKLGTLELLTGGVWRCQVLQHLVFLVSSVAAPVERDTAPLHLLAEESPETEHELARVIVEEPGLWEMYAPILGTLHANVWTEAKRMARSKKKNVEDYFNLQPLIDTVGVAKVAQAVGVKPLIDELGIDAVVKEIGIEELLAHLTPEQLRELKRRMAQRG